MSDSLVDLLRDYAMMPTAPSMLILEAAAALESLPAENERLRRLIVEHNRELCETCDKRNCGFKAYYRRCPECPREYVIAAHQASASSTIPLSELIAQYEADPEMAGHLAKAREWLKTNPLRPEDIHVSDWPSASSDASKPEETRTAAAVALPLPSPFNRVHELICDIDRDRYGQPLVAALHLCLDMAEELRYLRDTAPVGSQGGDDSGCGHDHGVER